MLFSTAVENQVNTCKGKAHIMSMQNIHVVYL